MMYAEAGRLVHGVLLCEEYSQLEQVNSVDEFKTVFLDIVRGAFVQVNESVAHLTATFS
jgi:hypothetical protein